MKPTPWYLLPLIPMGMILQEIMKKWRKPSDSICRQLRILYPSQRLEQVYSAYMLQQIVRIAGTWLFLILMIAWFLPEISGERQMEGVLSKPSFREGTRDTILIAQSEDERIQIKLKVEPRNPDSREIQRILINAKQLLLEDFQKMGEVHRSLQLPRNYGEVTVSYENADGLIDSSGYLHVSSKNKEYRMVLLQATLHYQEEQLKVDLELVLNTISLENLQSEILKAIEHNQTETEIFLPESVTVNGIEKEIIYFEPGNVRQWPILVLIGLLLPFLIGRLGQEQLQEENKKRKERIHQSFPFAAEKLSVYLGAGMGLQEAWGRTAMEGADSDPLIREMRLTYQQMRNGIGIQEAILQFGNRTESADLKKMSGILSRNIRRGDAYLLENLQNLNHEAWEQHRREVRIQVEKSQTKMLFPMLLMMGVVLILILTPAMISMM